MSSSAVGRTPPPRSATVSAQMSRMPRSSTGPEVALRRGLHAAGLRFRIHPRDLPGRPDIALTRAKLAVFVDGCFWHGCSSTACCPSTTANGGSRSSCQQRARQPQRRSADRRRVASRPFWEHEPVDDAVDAGCPTWREPSRRLLATGALPKGSAQTLVKVGLSRIREFLELRWAPQSEEARPSAAGTPAVVADDLAYLVRAIPSLGPGRQSSDAAVGSNTMHATGSTNGQAKGSKRATAMSGRPGSISPLLIHALLMGFPPQWSSSSSPTNAER